MFSKNLVKNILNVFSVQEEGKKAVPNSRDLLKSKQNNSNKIN